MSDLEFKRVAVVREGICPEDPDGVDPTVALLPAQVSRLVKKGMDVAVEADAGSLLGVENSAYEAVGAKIVDRAEIYRGRDLVVKIKGPPDEAIPEMDPGTTLFCMAHLPMYPEREAALKDVGVNVVAMEEVCADSYRMPHSEQESREFGRVIFNNILADLDPRDRRVCVIGYSERLDGTIRYLALQQLGSLQIVPYQAAIEGRIPTDPNVTFIYDSNSDEVVPCSISNIGHNRADFTCSLDSIHIPDLLPRGVVPTTGRRQIQCLHETGRAGAQFGYERMMERTSFVNGTPPEVLVVGYGNVAMGAIDGCLRAGLSVQLMNRFHTAAPEFADQLGKANLVVNGALIPAERAGIDYVITKEHVASSMKAGTVLIDLIGGSPTDRSPVEVVETCTFLGRPSFDTNGIQVASVFAWPNYYNPLETCQCYSSQIASVMLRRGGLATGVHSASPGVKRALVLEPVPRHR